jgi:flagellar biosynthesis/type III secretory pathway chaperone
MSAHLENALTQLAQTLGNFCQFLEQEAMALASQDADSLAALLPKRDEIHRLLATHWLQLAKLAGTDHPQGLADLRQRLFGQTPPPPAWQRLEELVHAADRLNKVNGRLMEEQIRRTQVALQILQQAASTRGVYDAAGKLTDFLNQNRQIDSA